MSKIFPHGECKHNLPIFMCIIVGKQWMACHFRSVKVQSVKTKIKLNP